MKTKRMMVLSQEELFKAVASYINSKKDHGSLQDKVISIKRLDSIKHGISFEFEVKQLVIN